MIPLHPSPESLFWYWIAERHQIYLRRMSGQLKPWTEDPILLDYKFTNPFRENDRGTVWLRENFLKPHWDDPLDLVAFNICWYRMFNWWGTGEYLNWQTEWQPEEIKRKLWAKSGQVFTGAHIIHSEPGRSKIDSIVDVCTHLWKLKERVVNCAGHLKSLEQVFWILREARHVGGFMAYEMVSDMRHTRLLENALDIMTWANPGPGAVRGLQRLSMACNNDRNAIHSMQELLAKSKENLPSDFPLLEMRDIEHSLC